jgi:hypothetical protein
MSVVDAAFEELIQRIDGLAAEFDKAWTDLVNAVNIVLPQLPGFLQPVVRGQFNKLSAKKDNAMEKFWKIYTERGSASAVRQVASDWNTLVGEKASDQAEKLTLTQLPSHNRWEGPAYIAYKEVVGFQSTKLGEVKTMTNAVQTTLNEIADAMKTFWDGMARTVGVYVLAMVACGITAATEVGIAPAIIAGIAATAIFFDKIGDLATTFANTLDTKEAALEAQQTLNGTDGKWPAVNAEALSDASVLDGDQKSDWTALP